MNKKKHLLFNDDKNAFDVHFIHKHNITQTQTTNPQKYFDNKPDFFWK